DGYQLAWELDNAWEQSIKSGSKIDINLEESVLNVDLYKRERRLQIAIIHGMARMAAMIASTYRAYLGVGLGPLEFLSKYRIPHPGRVGGRFFIQKMMPMMLSWVLGGNSCSFSNPVHSFKIKYETKDYLEKDDATFAAPSLKVDQYVAGSQTKYATQIQFPLYFVTKKKLMTHLDYSIDYVYQSV
ncbi:hypothetical protein S83_054167, partial [Arachis hypogaea]